jgi:Tfp pilus assembly protein PilF
MVPLANRLWTAAISYVWYLEKAFWPTDVMIIYPHSNHAARLFRAAVLVLVLISLLGVMWRRKRPYFAFGWFWYLGTLVPVIGLIQVGSQETADRYFYIPSIGLLVLIAWVGNELAGSRVYGRAIAGFVASAVAIACLAATRAQLAFWQDSDTLFSHALSVMPNNNLAWEYHAAYVRNMGRFEQARQELERSLRIYPRNPNVENDLAKLLLLQNKPDEAAEHFRLCLLSPIPNPEAHINLGGILLTKNRLEEAAEQFQTALRFEPGNEKARVQLGLVLMKQGKIEEAGKGFTECIRLAPEDAEAHIGLADVLTRQGKTGEAISQYQQALKLAPNAVEALNNLAWILATASRAELRDGKEGVRLAKRACELTHNKIPRMIGTLAAAYAEAGQFDEAAATAQRAHDAAAAIGRKEIAARNLELLELYRSHKPYHEQPPALNPGPARP